MLINNGPYQCFALSCFGIPTEAVSGKKIQQLTLDAAHENKALQNPTLILLRGFSPLGKRWTERTPSNE